jgi:hypothetical protein
MTPAASSQLLEYIQVTPAALPPAIVPATLPATIATRDGRYITGGSLEITLDGQCCWRGRMRNLERGGLVATMYFAEGVREVIVRLEDGRRAVARITGTSFIAASERVCDLAGVEPLT